MEEKSYDLDTFFHTSKEDLEKKITTIITDEKILSILKDGDRLRPMLSHLVFKACTQGKEIPQQYQRALSSAISIELAYAASIIHDNTIKGYKKKNNKLLFPVREELDNAILTGHKLLAIGFDIALSHGEKIAKLYVDTWNKILNGELKEINFNKRLAHTNSEDLFPKSEIINDYNKIIEMKTASLFSSGCKTVAMLAGSSEELSRLFAGYGREIGFAYQKANDLTRFEKGETASSVVIPILLRLEKYTINGDSLKSRNVRKIISQNSSEIRQIYIQDIRQHLHNAENIVRSEIIHPSPYKSLLGKAPVYLINKLLIKSDIAL